MAMYRIIDGGTIYVLDAVLSGGLNFSGQTTDRPLQDGTIISDHYVNNNNTGRVTGIVSDVKVLINSGSELSVQDERTSATLDWITEMEALKRTGRTFTFEAAPSSSTVLTDCVFTDLDISNDKKHGEFYKGFYSFNISASIKQIKKARKGVQTAQPDIVATKESTSSQKEGSGTTAQPKDEEQEEDFADTINAAKTSATLLGI